MSWGLTELTPQQFKKAIKELQLSWADDNRQIEMIYEHLDHNENKEQRGTLELEEIALGVLDCVSSSYKDHETKYLESCFNMLVKTNLVYQTKDMMNFHNFTRDYTCSGQEFIAMFRENF